MSGMHQRVWGLALPIMLSNLSVPLLGMVDTAMMGHMPDTRFLAGVAVGNTLIHFLFWGFGFLRMSTVGLTAQAQGEGLTQQVQHALTRGLLLALGLGLLLWALQGVLWPLGIALMEPPETAAAEAAVYWGIRIWGAPAVLMNYVLWGWFLGRQNATTPLLLMLVMNGSNALLDWWFVMGLGWETAGVARASVLAEYLSLALGLLLAWRGFTWRGPWLRGLWGDVNWRDYAAINGDLWLRTVSLLFAFAFFTAQSGQLGETVLAVNAVLLNFQLFVAYGLDGFAHAAEALVGKAKGAGSRQDLYRTFRATALWSAVASCAYAAVYAVSGSWVVMQLTDLQTVQELAMDYLPWVIATPIISVAAFWLDGVFIGAARSRDLRNSMLFAVFLIYLPSWYVLRPLDNHGLWLALMLFLLARGITLGWRFARITQQNAWFESLRATR